MKRLIPCLIVGVLLMPGWFSLEAAPPDSVTLEVMNPLGEIPPPPSFPPSPRVKELSGKRIGIYWLGKAGGDNFWDGVDELLKEKFPTANILRYQGPFDLGDERAAKIAKEVDTVLYGVGD
ncbi:MAG: hypothetical protein P8Y80_07355 [Acidobacteriota bacterium]|jgi:hypothetical protein